MTDEGIKGIGGKVKLSGWDLAVYNSEFTKKNCGKLWNIKSKVIYPPVDTDNFKSLDKKKIILSVGRFFGYGKEKKHEVLIEAFADIHKDIEGWTLILAGSAGEGDEKYVEDLKKKSKGVPIKFMVNVLFEEIKRLYGQSSIYWHAAGYGEEDPAKMEHFGISTVEAMSAGCVPVVTGKGGQVEIVEDKISGYLWNSIEELKKKTIKLVLDDKLRGSLSKEAIKKSATFGKEKFTQNLIDLISK
jgi:glycosyltransferase involved in cell wall biosynthesis